MALPAKIALAIVLAASAMPLAPIQRVSAHCPGTLAVPHDFAAGWQDVPSSDAIYAVIQYVNPTVCFTSQETAFSLEGINLCNEPVYCDRFVQVGWIKRKNVDSTPKMYCEYLGAGVYNQQFFPMTAEQHTYWWYQSGGTWNCALGTTVKISNLSLGWTSGTRFQAQGETNSVHTQIGGAPPAGSILFWNMQYRSGAWYQTDLWDIFWDSPYWVYEPIPGEMKNGTYSH